MGDGLQAAPDRARRVGIHGHRHRETAEAVSSKAAAASRHECRADGSHAQSMTGAASAGRRLPENCAMATPPSVTAAPPAVPV